MASEKAKPQQPSRAEQIRTNSAAKQKEIVVAFDKALKSDQSQQLANFLHAVGLAIVWGISFLPEIAAELAEANSRDREAEIRAKNAEGFVEALQQEISRQQQSGLLIPGAVQVKQRG